MKKGFIEEKAKALHVSENAVIRLVDLAFKETGALGDRARVGDTTRAHFA